ncbi:MAG TPA: CBS domain-containing protein [bacterium]|nr:CBS domain-containing protein [bacterium]
MRNLTAREIMSAPAVTVSPDTPVREVVTLMVRFGISGLPVADEQGRLLGIVTEADVLRKEERPQPSPPIVPWHGRSLWLERRVDQYQKLTGTTAGALMTENVLTATEDTHVRELVHLMLAHGVNRIPIVREGRVVGIVSRADVLTVFLRDDEEIVNEVRRSLAQDAGIDPSGLTITCTDGVVAVAGQIGRRSDRDLAVTWIRAVDGVIGVQADHFTYVVDDVALGRITA